MGIFLSYVSAFCFYGFLHYKNFIIEFCFKKALFSFCRGKFCIKGCFLFCIGSCFSFFTKVEVEWNLVFQKV